MVIFNLILSHPARQSSPVSLRILRDLSVEKYRFSIAQVTDDSLFFSITSAHFHFTYPLTPLFATLTKTTGVWVSLTRESLKYYLNLLSRKTASTTWLRASGAKIPTLSAPETPQTAESESTALAQRLPLLPRATGWLPVTEHLLSTVNCGLSTSLPGKRSATSSPIEYNRPRGECAIMTQAESAERGANVRFPPPLVYLAFILLGVALRYAMAPLRVPVNRYMALAAGMVVLLGGLGLIVEAWKLFHRTGQDPKPWKTTPEIVLSGPYRFTRNPMYVGMVLIQIGLGLALNNLWIVLLSAFSLLVIHFIAVMPEEEYLSEKFGDAYRSYLSKVRRYL